jgi:hypothetical protein
MNHIFLKSLASLAIYLANLIIVWIAIVNFFKVDVVFYAAISAAIISTFFQYGILIFIKQFGSFSTLERHQNALICALIGYAVAISVPTVIDRSLSFYILEKLNQRGGEIKREDFEKIFTTEFVMEHRVGDIRLTEQIESGTVEFRNGCVKLTPKGEKIAILSRAFRKNLLPKHRLIMGEYTDQLTDPFRNSVSTLDYSCH